jgi:hypothetical protein
MAKGFQKVDNPQHQPAVFALHEISDPRCKVCKSPFRREIDAMLATGWSGEKVRRYVNNILGNEYFNPQNISNHRRKHLTLKDDAVREIMEERFRAAGHDLESVVGLITTTEGIVGTVAQIGLQNVVRGTAHVDAPTLLQALQLIEKLKEGYEDESAVELEREMKAFIKAVKTVVQAWIGQPVEERMYTDIVDEFQRLLGIDPLHAEIPALEAAQFEEIQDGSS